MKQVLLFFLISLITIRMAFAIQQNSSAPCSKPRAISDSNQTQTNQNATSAVSPDTPQQPNPENAAAILEFPETKMVNGYIWKGLNTSQKEMYLLGYQDGVSNTIRYHITDPAEQTQAYSMIPFSLNKNASLNIREEIDKFYADKNNTVITIPYVLLIIRNRLLKMSEEEINEYVSYLRDNFERNEVKSDKTP